MRLVSMLKHLKSARLEFYGCRLKCGYCPHRLQAKRDIPYGRVLSFLSDVNIDEVLISGAEPTLQGDELAPLVKELALRDKRIILKTAGWNPAFIKGTLGCISQYIVEFKCPIGDVQRCADLTGVDQEIATDYLRRLQETLDLLRGQQVRADLRVIPGFIGATEIEAMGRELQGVAQEACLYQFMGSPVNDMPFAGISQPSPSMDIVLEYGTALRQFLPRVRVQGDGFDWTMVS
jgi:pyruvate formate lyase activating enzyme